MMTLINTIPRNLLLTLGNVKEEKSFSPENELWHNYKWLIEGEMHII